MTRGIRQSVAMLGLGLLAVLVGGLAVQRGVETDLLGLAAGQLDPATRALSQSTAAWGRVILEGTDFAALKQEADAVATQLGQSVAVDFPRTLQYLESRKRGLLAPATRQLLEQHKYDEVTAAALARLYGFGPPLFSVKRDPFLLGTDYAMSLQSNLSPGWSLREGYAVCEQEGRSYLLLSFNLARVPAERVLAVLARARTCAADTAAPVRIWCAGPPFHSVLSAQRAQREINYLSVISLALVLLFGWRLFRSFRFVPRLLFVQTCAALSATAVLFAVFGRPHVLTFVFGTSLIGLSVDYVYHACTAGGGRRILRPLMFSLVTTIACFLPLLFSEMSVLRQMAVFTGTGLLVVFLLVVGKREEGDVPPPCSVKGWTWTVPRWVCVALLLSAAGGWGRLTVVNDGRAFYRPDAFLAQGEALLAQLNPVAQRGVVWVRGRTLQEALEREEAAGLNGLSAVIPSLARQRENARLIDRFHTAAAASYTAQTGLRVPPPEGEFLDADQLADEGLQRVVEPFRVTGGLVVPCPEDFTSNDPNLVIVRPQEMVRDLFERFFASTVRLLGVAGIVLGVLLVLLFRRRVIAAVAPLVGAFATTVGWLGWLGVPLTCFTVLCFFILVGLGLDYIIFHRTVASAATRRTVFVSFLTSLAGLGMLAFTAFPVTHDMGLTLALGLACCYVFSLSRNDAVAPDDEGKTAWYRQREQSAGRVRLWLMWQFYAWLGKGVLKCVCVVVMAFIYPFARPAKAALRVFYQVLSEAMGARIVPTTRRLYCHLLGFAWSLVDKTDACSLKKNLPQMEVRQDAGWQAFQTRLDSGKGGFVISTHVGTIEVLPALQSPLGATLGTRIPHVHAFQQMGHDSAFTRVFMRHFDAAALTLHPVEAIGVETAVQMQEAIARGDLVLMAGDRVSAGSTKTLTHEFLGRMCRWPKGVFAFARLMEAPIFFVTCVRTGWNRYEVHVEEFQVPSASGWKLGDLVAQYVSFVEREVRQHPEQWYQFYDFFSS